jgi:hypothetical protein
MFMSKLLTELAMLTIEGETKFLGVSKLAVKGVFVPDVLVDTP